MGAFKWLFEEKYWKTYKIDHEVIFDCFSQKQGDYKREKKTNDL